MQFETAANSKLSMKIVPPIVLLKVGKLQEPLLNVRESKTVPKRRNKPTSGLKLKLVPADTKTGSVSSPSTVSSVQPTSIVKLSLPTSLNPKNELKTTKTSLDPKLVIEPTDVKTTVILRPLNNTNIQSPSEVKLSSKAKPGERGYVDMYDADGKLIVSCLPKWKAFAQGFKIINNLYNIDLALRIAQCGSDLLKDARPDLFEQLDPTKTYRDLKDFDNLKVNYSLKLWWICFLCTRSFEASPRHRSLGRHSGCRTCNNKLVDNAKKVKQAKAEVRYALWFMKLLEKYIDSKTAHKCQCTKCGKITTKRIGNLRTEGCTNCDALRRGKKLKLSQIIAEEAFLDVGLILLEEYRSNRTLHRVRCVKCGKEILRRLNDAERCGCSNCHAITGESFGASLVRAELVSRGIDFDIETRLDFVRSRRFDFQFKVNGVEYIYEFDGELHFRETKHFHGEESKFSYWQEVDRLKTHAVLYSGKCIIRSNAIKPHEVSRFFDKILSHKITSPTLFVSSMEKYGYIINVPLNQWSLDQIPGAYREQIIDLKKITVYFQ